ncbi:Prolyl oligopeptidase family protein, partial [hydrothermal vent metagenome]
MKKYALILLSLILSLSVYSQKQAGIIEKPHLKLKSDVMTPEVLWSFGRLSDPQLSPDGKTLVYGITYYSKKQNKGNRELYSIGVDGKNLKQLTHTPGSEHNAVWHPDGKKIGFL